MANFNVSIIFDFYYLQYFYSFDSLKNYRKLCMYKRFEGKVTAFTIVKICIAILFSIQ